MRLLHIDIDTLRADHLSCYGYLRQTTPNIDRIAAEGVRFENCFVADAPCLPSRASLFTGRFGIHTGVVNHGGTTADLWLEGRDRNFEHGRHRWHWPMAMAGNGKYPVSVSSFAERHGAWWFCGGFREMYNPGKCGGERADEVVPIALRWLEQKGKTDDWYLHINIWDPHTPYRTPMEYGNPFENDPPDPWITDEVIARHRQGYGPNSACEPVNYWGLEGTDNPRLPKQMASRADFKRWIDGYDTGIHYADMYTGRILELLDRLGVLEDTAIIVSSDHGENHGELNIYGDHHAADVCTSRVPCIVKWPGLAPRVERGLYYQSDIAASILDLWGMEVPGSWDGRSFAGAFKRGEEAGRDYLVVSQCAWTCQRSVRFGRWLLIRTYHTGLKAFPAVMLFDLERDPHEQHNLVEEEPAVANQGLAHLENWHGEMMQTSDYDIDPLWQTIHEGGPLHTRGYLELYCQRLRQTGRAHHAEFLEKWGCRPVPLGRAKQFLV